MFSSTHINISIFRHRENEELPGTDLISIYIVITRTCLLYFSIVILYRLKTASVPHSYSIIYLPLDISTCFVSNLLLWAAHYTLIFAKRPRSELHTATNQIHSILRTEFWIWDDPVTDEDRWKSSSTLHSASFLNKLFECKKE